MRQFAFLAASVFLATQAHATTLVRVDLATQIDEAELIFSGTVVHTEVQLASESKFPFTLVTFAVEEILKGATENEGELTLIFAGGRTEEEISLIPGIPVFREGGRHLLFVKDNGQTACPLVGWVQGKLDLHRHPLTGEEVLTDAQGFLLTGIEDRKWQRSAVRIQADGSFSSRRDDGVTLLSQENVVITDPQPDAETLRRSTLEAVRDVLTDLRSYVGGRAGLTELTTTGPVRSATRSDVPASLTDRSADRDHEEAGR